MTVDRAREILAEQADANGYPLNAEAIRRGEDPWFTVVVTRAMQQYAREQNQAAPALATDLAAVDVAADYMTSANHHPDHVLIPLQKFQELRALTERARALAEEQADRLVNLENLVSQLASAKAALLMRDPVYQNFMDDPTQYVGVSPGLLSSYVHGLEGKSPPHREDTDHYSAWLAGQHRSVERGELLADDPGAPTWVPWHGEYSAQLNMPSTLGQWHMVEVLRRDGRVSGPYAAGSIEWHHQQVASDIMFWRPAPVTKPLPTLTTAKRRHRAGRGVQWIVNSSAELPADWSRRAVDAVLSLTTPAETLRDD